MVVVDCAACGLLDGPGHKFYKFPADVQWCNSWAMLIDRHDLLDLPPGVCRANHGLCGIHFRPIDFNDGKLKKNVFPEEYGYRATSSSWVGSVRATAEPVAEAPADENPAVEAPADENPAVEAPADENPAVEAPADLNPAAVAPENPGAAATEDVNAGADVNLAAAATEDVNPAAAANDDANPAANDDANPAANDDANPAAADPADAHRAPRGTRRLAVRLADALRAVRAAEVRFLADDRSDASETAATRRNYGKALIAYFTEKKGRPDVRYGNAVRAFLANRLITWDTAVLYAQSVNSFEVLRVRDLLERTETKHELLARLRAALGDAAATRGVRTNLEHTLCWNRTADILSLIQRTREYETILMAGLASRTREIVPAMPAGPPDVTHIRRTVFIVNAVPRDASRQADDLMHLPDVVLRSLI